MIYLYELTFLYIATISEHWCSHDVDTLPQKEVHRYVPSYQPACSDDILTMHNTYQAMIILCLLLMLDRPLSLYRWLLTSVYVK